MAPESLKRPKDFSQAAKFVVDMATGAAKHDDLPPDTPAQEFARKGGLKGSKTRAAALTLAIWDATMERPKNSAPL